MRNTYIIALYLWIASVAGFAQALSLGEHAAVLDGVEFHYVVAGHGPLLVVQAPGWGIGSTYLERGLAPLEQHFTLVFYDPRGSGRSSRPTGQAALSTSGMIDDLEQLRVYWELESLDLIGHSQGGSVVLGYAERYPGHVHKLLLVDTSLLGYDSSAMFKATLAGRRSDPRYSSSIGQLKGSFHTDEEFKGYFVNVIPFYFYDPAKNVPSLLGTIPNAFSFWAYGALRSSDQAHPMQQEAELSNVQADTLILAGSDDPFSPEVVSDRIHTGIRGSKLIILEKSGHFPWIEQSAKFFDSAMHFFKR